MTTQNSATDFGQYLQSCREAKNISLEAVSRITRISMSSLRQIECEEWSALPAPLYVKGFLKAYAEAIGIDASEALRRYENGLAPQGAGGRVRPKGRSRQAMGMRLFWSLAALAGVIALTLTAGRFIHHTGEIAPPPSAVETGRTASAPVPAVKPRATAPAAATPAATAPEAAAPTPAAGPAGNPVPAQASAPENPVPPTATQEPAAAGQADAGKAAGAPAEGEGQEAGKAADGLRLTMSATEPVWVKVISDGQHSREVMLKTDQQVTLQAAERFSLLIGNAGGIRLTLNGHSVHVPGRSGQVVTMQLP